jgi:glucan biosynthesis protein
MFSYGKNKFADKIPDNLGFAGFRLAYPLYKKDEYNHVAVFAGASYFRAVAKNQVFDLSARGLAIDTGLSSGEEFPTFREFWLERPAPSARSMKVYALLDSQSLTGAYEFIFRPGERTTVAALHRELCQINLETESLLAPAIRSVLPALKRLQQSGTHDHAPDGAPRLSNGEAHWQAI